MKMDQADVRKGMGFLLFLWMGGAAMGVVEAVTGVKGQSSLYPPEVRERLRANLEAAAWGKEAREKLVRDAKPWVELSDAELRGLMFGPGITRSWMVWSNGFCPSCKRSVPMYTWKMDPFEKPWKVWCPHCGQVFPKNDFYAFYRSGLDDDGFFQAEEADRSLLFNEEHPDPGHPLHSFGVDDGEGYLEGKNRWRFIGAYLIYGQWKRAVLGGIRALSGAYLVTGEPVYAQKASVLLDRVADFYPLFDYSKQAVTYEKNLGSAGYISVWHDACEETREMALAYDMIFDAIRQDKERTQNIENRILLDALQNRHKIRTNYPRTEIAESIMLAVLGREQHEKAFWSVVDPMLKKATSVDGVTGEKGLANYSAFTIQALADFIGELNKADPAFVGALVERCPRLHQTFRFHVDTWCLGRYYPLSGDTGWFASPVKEYRGMTLKRSDGVKPSAYTLLWKLYGITGDEAFVQVMVKSNDGKVEGLPFDPYVDHPAKIQAGVRKVIEEEGKQLELGSVNKKEWHLGILRSGRGEERRAVWLDYDSGGGHGHHDAMNLGLFAKGLDLLPDFGYPPVQFGGWGSERSRWYGLTAAHNTVVVDGQNAADVAGKTTLWAENGPLHVIRVDGSPMNRGNAYERTVVLVDVAEDLFYVVDLFRVMGGHRHTQFLHSHFGRLSLEGVNPLPVERSMPGVQMRDWKMGEAVEPGWTAEWQVEDRYSLLKDPKDLRVQYTGFTQGANVGMAEAWIVAGLFNSSEEAWIPRLVVERVGEEPLESLFVGVLDVAEGDRKAIASAEREAPDGNEIKLTLRLVDGRKDVLISRGGALSWQRTDEEGTMIEKWESGAPTGF